MYAFLSHHSACEALRALGDNPTERWPSTERYLPMQGDAVSNQRGFKSFCEEVDLAAKGVVATPVDLLVALQSQRGRGKAARFHVWHRLVPARSMIRLGDGLFTSGPELTLIQLSGSYSRLDPLLDASVESIHAEEELHDLLGLEGRLTIDDPLAWERMRRLVAATVVACEFAGTYRLGTGGAEASYHAPRLMTLAGLRKMTERTIQFGKTSMETHALRVVDLAFENSASPMETAVVLMLSLPVEYGGFGLPKPQLNRAIDVSGHRGILAERDEVTPDLLWEDANLALEYDSAGHHGQAGPARLAEDAVRSNILTALGYRVLRVTNRSIASLEGMSLLARQVAHLLGIELEMPTDLQQLRRQKLFQELMPKAMD